MDVQQILVIAKLSKSAMFIFRLVCEEALAHSFYYTNNDSIVYD